MISEDALFLKRNIFSPRKGGSKTVFCRTCKKQLTGENTSNRWIRFVIDIRKKNWFRDVVTDNDIFAGGYCCRDHLLVDVMKQIENFPDISV